MFLTLPAVKNECPNLSTCSQALRSMVPTMRAMFPRVEGLIRLLIVNPAFFATTDRSFGSLRRLKTYLRSTYGQRRLNSIAICHVHKYVIDGIDVRELMKEFVLRRDSRAAAFGHVLVYPKTTVCSVYVWWNCFFFNVSGFSFFLF